MNPVNQLSSILAEIDSLDSQFDMSKNDSEITSASGRVYRVANVLQNRDQTFAVSEVVSQGLFVCRFCNDKSNYYPGYSWRQYTHGDDVVRLHIVTKHIMKNHPEKTTAEYLELPAKVFIG